MNKLKRLFATLLSFLFILPALAQEKVGGIKKSEDHTDFMLSDGKIYVVVAVIVIILCGLFLYLYNLDKKISALEKRKP